MAVEICYTSESAKVETERLSRDETTGKGEDGTDGCGEKGIAERETKKEGETENE